MLEWVGLGGMGGRYVHELSGGQQQRVSLGRAMVGKPRAILFDEPLSNLDARLRERMRMELLALRQEAPFTSIYVTHDQLEAMTLGDRVVVMRAGKIEQVGIARGCLQEAEDPLRRRLRRHPEPHRGNGPGGRRVGHRRRYHHRHPADRAAGARTGRSARHARSPFGRP